MMNRKQSVHIILSIALFGFAWLVYVNPAQAGIHLQQPTVDVPTVTSSPSGPMITVNQDPSQPQINVRGGPGTDYPIVGVLVAGQTAPALGRSPGGNWIMIVYPVIEGGKAWVYSPLVSVNGTLAIVEPPSTPTPRVTPTIDPTLAAQFIVEIPPTRLPTFTAPAPIIVPTFDVPSPTFQGTVGVPMGFIIIGLAVVGIFGLFISFLRGR